MMNDDELKQTRMEVVYVLMEVLSQHLAGTGASN
jgi:hypothetical protein